MPVGCELRHHGEADRDEPDTSDQSPQVTQPEGLMYPELTGDATQKARIIYDWVVNSRQRSDDGRRMTRGWLMVVSGIVLAVAAAPAQAQDAARRENVRTQYPAVLANSFFSVGVGGIDYEFSSAQLTRGFQAASVRTPHPAARIGLFGHEFNRYIAAQATYMRPASFVAYQDVNADGVAHHVWMAVGAVTVRGRLPLTRRVDAYGEGGFGITSRHGFTVKTGTVVPDLHYISAAYGAGLDYHVTPSWDLVGGTLVVPGRSAGAESPSLMTTLGFQYTMRPLPAERVFVNAHSGFAFPNDVVQVETSTAFGYGVNRFFGRTVPVFWDGTVRVDRGVALHVDHNVFHTRKVFALDVGGSLSEWRSQQEQDRFYTVSIYPQFRFVFLRTRSADVWAVYSLAGPTYLSRSVIDGADMGSRFTFQDFMGVGAFVGRSRRVSLGVKINHYSNGNMFTQNAAVTVPITITVGYAL